MRRLNPYKNLRACVHGILRISSAALGIMLFFADGFGSVAFRKKHNKKAAVQIFGQRTCKT